MFENLLENKGVQMMLGELVKRAAPELQKTIEQFTMLVAEFNDRTKRIETKLDEILNERKDNGPVAPSTGIAGNIHDIRGEAESIGGKTGG